MSKSLADTCARLVSSAASTNATSLSSMPVDVFHIIATNTTAALKYLKLYNTKTTPVVGTDIPFVTIALPVSNLPISIDLPSGLYFNQGLGYALTGAVADNNTTALAAGDVIGLNILYKA